MPLNTLQLCPNVSRDLVTNMDHYLKALFSILNMGIVQHMNLTYSENSSDQESWASCSSLHALLAVCGTLKPLKYATHML